MATKDTQLGRKQGVCLCELDHPFSCLRKPPQGDISLLQWTKCCQKVFLEGESLMSLLGFSC